MEQALAAPATQGMPATPPPKSGGDPVAALFGDASRARRNVAADDATISEMEERVRAPRLTPPPPQQAVTDPLQAFGQPAMWLAAIGSLFTRRPFTNSIISAGQVLKATHEQDQAAAQSAYNTWKTETENSIKLAKYEQDAYKAAISKKGVDVREADADLRATITAFQNAPLLKVYQTEGFDGVSRYIETHGKSLKKVEDGAEKFDITHGAEIDARTIAAYNQKINRGETVPDQEKRSAEDAKARQDARIAPKVAEARAKSDATAIDDDAAKQIAEQTLVGDYHGTTGLARNSSSMRKIADWRAKLAKEQGLTGADLASKDAEFIGQTAAQRVLGVRGAGIEVGIAEAQRFAPMVLELSDKIDRTQFPTINSLELGAEKGTGGEDVVRLVDALNAYKMAYTQILTRGGMPTDDSRKRSDEVIDKNWSSGQIKAAIDQLGKEMTGAQSAVPAVKDELYHQLTGKTRNSAPGSSDKPPAQYPDAKKAPDGHWYVQKDGKYFRVKE